jgi:hypothetical protein
VTSRKISIALGVVGLAIACVSCFTSEANLTESGKGKPDISVTFPHDSPPASVQTATVRVGNPGPGRMQSLIVAFSRVGKAGEKLLPDPLVDVGTNARTAGVVRVDPKPRGVSPDGIVYRFAGVDVGSTRTVHFSIRVPTQPGIAANSVQAYAGEEPDRIRGALLMTDVGGIGG